MNKTKNIHNKNKLIVASIAIVVALALFASPIVAMDDAFATKKKYKGGNVAEQSISPTQSSNFEIQDLMSTFHQHESQRAQTQ